MSRQRVLFGCLVFGLVACSSGNPRRRVAEVVDGGLEASAGAGGQGLSTGGSGGGGGTGGIPQPGGGGTQPGGSGGMDAGRTVEAGMGGATQSFDAGSGGSVDGSAVDASSAGGTTQGLDGGLDASIDGARDSGSKPPPNVTVTLSVQGSGTVSIAAQSIQCTSAAPCVLELPVGTSVALDAAPDIGNGFNGWSGPCAGTTRTCNLVLDGDTTVGATFATAPPRTLTIVLTSIFGHVLDAKGNVLCGPGSNFTATCTLSYPSETDVALFSDLGVTNWNGACVPEASPGCHVLMQADTQVNVTVQGGCPAAIALPAACSTPNNFSCCYRSDASSPYDGDSDGYMACNTECGALVDRCTQGGDPSLAQPCDCNDSDPAVYPRLVGTTFVCP